MVIFCEGRGGGMRAPGSQVAAVIHGVGDDTVDLTLFGPGYAAPRMVCDVPYDEDGKPGTWHWPTKI